MLSPTPNNLFHPQPFLLFVPFTLSPLFKLPTSRGSAAYSNPSTRSTASLHKYVKSQPPELLSPSTSCTLHPSLSQPSSKPPTSAGSAATCLVSSAGCLATRDSTPWTVTAKRPCSALYAPRPPLISFFLSPFSSSSSTSSINLSVFTPPWFQDNDCYEALTVNMVRLPVRCPGEPILPTRVSAGNACFPHSSRLLVQLHASLRPSLDKSRAPWAFPIFQKR